MFDKKEYMKNYYREHLDYFKEHNKRTHKKWNKIHNKINNPIYQPRRIVFKDKRISIKEDPRYGICQLCGAVRGMDCKQTQMHHLQYHEEDPLKDTIEVCVKCHKRQHKIGRIV
jgi:hypothetical protein